MPLTTHDLIFKQWETTLKTKDRSWTYVESNFEELFESLKQSGLEATNAHDYISKAIKAHSPESSLIKYRYKATRAINPRVGTEKEFAEHWLAGIAAKADTAFFNIFPQKLVKPDPAKIVAIQQVSEFEAEDDTLTLE